MTTLTAEAAQLLAGDHAQLVDQLAQREIRQPHRFWYWQRLLLPLEQAGLLTITPDPDPKVGRNRIRIAWTEAGRAAVSATPEERRMTPEQKAHLRQIVRAHLMEQGVKAASADMQADRIVAKAAGTWPSSDAVNQEAAHG